MNSAYGMGAPLEPGHDLRRQWMDQASAFVQAELDGLFSAPACGPGEDELARALEALPRGLPEAPISLPEALERIGQAAGLGLQTTGPGYLAYIPGGGLFSAALAGFVSACLNRYVGVAAAGPGMVRFEQEVISWFCSELAMPPTAGGILTSGGSMAGLSAIIAARVNAFADGGDFSRATVYLSSQAHRSMVKAARLAGIPAANVRMVPVDGCFRMSVEALEAAIKADRGNGMRPFLVGASAGTTNTGAIDPLEPIADLCERQRLWLHVDGAYGGMFIVVDQCREKLRGINRAHSVTLDPHKGLFLPYGCGALVVRDADTLLRAHAQHAGYLQDLQDAAPSPSPSDLGPELSRNERGLLVWLPLALHGVEAFRIALAEKLNLAQNLRAALSHLAVEVPVEPELSIVAFRLPRGPDEALADWNRRNAAWLRRINAARRVHLSSTMLPVTDGQALTLRACVLSFRTDGARIEMLGEDLASTI